MGEKLPQPLLMASAVRRKPGTGFAVNPGNILFMSGVNMRLGRNKFRNLILSEIEHLQSMI
jgi:hypothetical protein